MNPPLVNSVPSGPSDCNRFEWLLPALLENEPEARAHLADCAACRLEYAAVRDLFGEIAVALPLAAAPDLRPAVLARIGALSHENPPRRTWLRRQGWLSFAAAAALLFIAVSAPLVWRLGAAASGPLPAVSANHATFGEDLFTGVVAYENDDADSTNFAESGDLTLDLLSGLQPSPQDMPAL